MNVQPNPAAASIAGVSRAAARGGEHEKRMADAAQQQQTAEAPAGKSADSPALDAGTETADRGGDGRQTYDTFDRSDQESEAEPADASASEPAVKDVSAEDHPPAEHLDLQG